MITNSWAVRPHFIAALLMTASGCAGDVVQSPLGRTQALALTDRELNEHGEQAFMKFKEQTAIETGDAVNRYVECVSRALIAEAKDPTGITKWEVVVYGSDRANVSSWPGGKIAVTTAMLSAARTPGQLAAALGNTIASLIARHPNERISKRFRSDVASGAVGAVLGLPSSPDARAPVQPDSVLLLEADTLGQHLMARAGFDPEESLRLWENMQWHAGASELTTQRIANLKNALPESLKLYGAARRAGKVPTCSAPSHAHGGNLPPT